MTKGIREYEFPAGYIKIYRNKSVRWFPKHTPFICIKITRTEATDALKQLRKFRRESNEFLK